MLQGYVMCSGLESAGLQGSAQGPWNSILTLGEENSERSTRWTFSHEPEFILIRVLLAARDAQATKVKVIITPLMRNPELGQYQDLSNQ